MSESKELGPRVNWLAAAAMLLVIGHGYANFLLAPQTVSPMLGEAYSRMWQQPGPLVAAVVTGVFWAVCSVWASVAVGRLSNNRERGLLKRSGTVLLTLGLIGSTTYVSYGFMSSAVYHATVTSELYADQITPYLTSGGLMAVLFGTVLAIAARLRGRRGTAVS